MIWTLLIAFIAVACFAVCKFVDEYEHDLLHFVACVIGFIFVLILIIMLLIILSEHTFINQKIDALQAERDALVYQMDNKLYLGDALGDFNKKIISCRYTHDNPWTSWLQGDYVFKVDPIPLK